MLCEIRIERGTALHSRAVMFDHLFKRVETAIVHVRCGERHVAQRGRSELAAIRRLSRDLLPSRVGYRIIQSIIGKRLALEKRPSMAMKTICAKLVAAGVILRHEQFKTLLLLLAQLNLPFHGPIKL